MILLIRSLYDMRFSESVLRVLQQAVHLCFLLIPLLGQQWRIAEVIHLLFIGNTCIFDYGSF